MAEINLDIGRKARAEKRGTEQHFVKISGKKFKLPAELPLPAAIAFDEGDAKTAMRELFNGEADKVLAVGWSREDFLDMVTQVLDLYGGGAPNPEASGSSS